MAQKEKSTNLILVKFIRLITNGNISRKKWYSFFKISKDCGLYLNHYFCLGIFFLISKWAATYANKVICISKSLESFYENSKIVKKEKLLTIPYGFNFTYTPSSKDGVKFNFGYPEILNINLVLNLKILNRKIGSDVIKCAIR